MAKDRIVKFCAQVGPRNVCLVLTNFLPDGSGQGQISVNISKTVQDTDILTMED